MMKLLLALMPGLLVDILKMVIETYTARQDAYQRGAADAALTTSRRIAEVADDQAQAIADRTDDPHDLARRLRERAVRQRARGAG